MKVTLDYLDRGTKLPTATEIVCFMAIVALLLTTALAVDQRNNLRRKDARIQELDNTILKQAAKK